ncbi:hypothetical protein WMY93_017495 [Mugilogobius chulae]|uniref:Inositol-tetrakisphosphate 1-kinase n=1 Tax=Mugilogobius chulae TaxID=88201 RepID=A0AAW0NPJ5_9GOBI
MQTFLKGRRVGYWLSEKKLKKLNFQAFADLCRKRGIEVVQLDLSNAAGAESTGLHRCTPKTIVLDPLPAIRTLLDRCKSYQLVRRIESSMQDDRICSPPFMVLNSECSAEVLEQIRKQGLTFPFICKTRVAHGTNSHEMAIIFSEEDLKDVKPPCVIQSFINHNAVLYKVFVVGDSHTVVERPSLKNFPPGPADRKAIFFNSHNVSKPESSSDLTSRDNALGVSLFGIDVIINNQTGQHAVIDINAFPGYEGVPEFFNDLLNHISSVLQSADAAAVPVSSSPPAQGCCGLLGKEASGPWIVEGDSGLKALYRDWVVTQPCPPTSNNTVFLLSPPRPPLNDCS